VVKIGFITEGESEKKVLESDKFQEFLQSLAIECVLPIIDANGNNNQLPHNREVTVQTLRDLGASSIFIVTDKDQEQCFTSIKDRIKPGIDEKVIVSVKQLEAWFLADSSAMKNYLQIEIYSCDHPESFDNPINEIKRIRLSTNGRGVSDKLILTKQMIQSGFSIENAASHPNCPSAKYFIERLKSTVS
jgi:Domain of unknown function (DUF4276)